MKRTYLALPLVAILGLSGRSALASPILLPPSDPGFDAPLSALADQYQRQQDVFAAAESGISLDVFVKPTEIDTVKAFFAQTAETDFKTFSGKHPFEVLDTFQEYGDEGNFAGIATVGVAARLLWLRGSGAPEDQIKPARDAAIAAARTWHVYGAIGGPGVVARGVRRTKPLDASAPPLPGMIPMVTPLADGQGNPLPKDKVGTWRGPVVPGFDDWIWMDDTSKDQVSGYVLAATWLWDALKGDPAVPSDVPDALATDLVAFAKALMKVAPELKIDLCIRDADGRLTSFHDLNPRQIQPDAVIPDKVPLRNGFNAAMALGIIRSAYHVSGDPDVGAYYYSDLVGTRDLPGEMAENSGVIFAGTATNYSNVNMLAISLATIGRFETDAYVREQLDSALQKQFWSTGDSRDVSHVKQGWFDAVYGSYAKVPADDVRPRIAENLGGFKPPPAFERDIQNCDETEIAAGVCTAIDGVTQIKLASGTGHGGGIEAADIVPMALRPDSDFQWRSDPHDVNGNASNLMDPGGDFLAAYWLARLSDRDDTSKNLTLNPRMALPYTMGSAGAGGAAGSGAGGESGSAGAPGGGGAAGSGAVMGTGGGGATGTGGMVASAGGSGGVAGSGPSQAAPAADGSSSDGSGCGCRTSAPPTTTAWWAASGLFALAAGRRRRRS